MWWKERGQGRSFYKPVGRLNAYGYLVMGIDYATYTVHQLAFVLYEGRWPELGKVINHLNGNKTDNRRCNLQETTHKKNIQHRVSIPANNTSGGIGVSWSKRDNRWRVRLRHNGIDLYGGVYSDFNAAVAARDRLAIAYGHNRQSNFLNISNETKV